MTWGLRAHPLIRKLSRAGLSSSNDPGFYDKIIRKERYHVFGDSQKTKGTWSLLPKKGYKHCTWTGIDERLEARRQTFTQLISPSPQLASHSDFMEPRTLVNDDEARH